jgi:hypothetical protein
VTATAGLNEDPFVMIFGMYLNRCVLLEIRADKMTKVWMASTPCIGKKTWGYIAVYINTTD